MGVINFPQAGLQQQHSAPLIMFVDLQKEYIAQGRAFHIHQIEDCLSNCKMLLDLAREKKLPIAHFRLVQDSFFFNKQTGFADWIEEFKPRPNELVYEHNHKSCYSNEAFNNLVSKIKRPQLIMAGLSAQSSCLATAIEANQRDHDLIFVRNASASTVINGQDESLSHHVATEIINTFTTVANLEQVICSLDSP